MFATSHKPTITKLNVWFHQCSRHVDRVIRTMLFKLKYCWTTSIKVMSHGCWPFQIVSICTISWWTPQTINLGNVFETLRTEVKYLLHAGSKPTTASCKFTLLTGTRHTWCMLLLALLTLGEYVFYSKLAAVSQVEWG